MVFDKMIVFTIIALFAKKIWSGSHKISFFKDHKNERKSD